jgi:hypothetical protein
MKDRRLRSYTIIDFRLIDSERPTNTEQAARMARISTDQQSKIEE